MGGRKHSDEEVIWAKAVITKELDGRVTRRGITEKRLSKRFRVKFGRMLAMEGMYYWFQQVMNPNRGCRGQNKTKNPTKVFERSKFIAHIKNVGMFGFDTEDEVKTFVQTSSIVAGVDLFKRIGVDIEVKVNIK